jgi:hypothetical protein
MRICSEFINDMNTLSSTLVGNTAFFCIAVFIRIYLLLLPLTGRLNTVNIICVISASYKFFSKIQPIA